MTSHYKMALLVFTSIWMSFASEKLGRKIERAMTGEDKSMQVATLGQVWARVSLLTGTRRMVKAISGR
jgi:hypothetical protein